MACRRRHLSRERARAADLCARSDCYGTESFSVSAVDILKWSPSRSCPTERQTEREREREREREKEPFGRSAFGLGDRSLSKRFSIPRERRFSFLIANLICKSDRVDNGREQSPRNTCAQNGIPLPGFSSHSSTRDMQRREGTKVRRINVE
jgi:hypothetical protein